MVEEVGVAWSRDRLDEDKQCELIINNFLRMLNIQNQECSKVSLRMVGEVGVA